MAKASASFGRLRQRLWNNDHVSMRVKGKIHRALVLSTLLHGAEAWTVYRQHMKKMHAFMMRHLRSITRITWMDKMTNKDILERTGLPSMEDLLIKKNLHEDVTKADSLFSNVFWSQRERAPSSPVQVHQEQLEAERHKDRHMDITLRAER